MPAQSVDIVVTDPPYLVKYSPRDGRNVGNDDHNGWLKPAFSGAYRLLKPNSYCLSFYGWPRVDGFMSAWKSIGFFPVSHLIFLKKYPSKVGHTQSYHEVAYLLAKGRPPKPANPISDVFEWKYTGNRFHPTEKPVEVMRTLINTFSKPGDIVLDPFAGSGTTGVAARETSRRFILIENIWCDCQIAEDRIKESRSHPPKAMT